jgi:hypothetical protein
VVDAIESFGPSRREASFGIALAFGEHVIRTIQTRRFAMQIELSCPLCACRFAAPPECGSSEVFERMFEDGPRYALGDGETFEDMIFTTLMDHGQISCPDCGEPAAVSEESLGQLAMEVLAQW